jgi:hypothetical protein
MSVGNLTLPYFQLARLGDSGQVLYALRFRDSQEGTDAARFSVLEDVVDEGRSAHNLLQTDQISWPTFPSPGITPSRFCPGTTVTYSQVSCGHVEDLSSPVSTIKTEEPSQVVTKEKHNNQKKKKRGTVQKHTTPGIR